MNILKPALKISTFFVVAFMASLFLIEAQRTYSYNKTIAEIPAEMLSITPSPTTTISQSEMPSPEGSKMLELEVSTTGSKTRNTISITDIAGEEAPVRISSSVHEILHVPFNTWSPNTFYFFLKTKDEYYVYQSSGEPFPSGEEYVTINSLFEENMGDYTIDDVTGWADNTLLIVNATSSTGDKVSFWFEVPSRAFIQLGNYFE